METIEGVIKVRAKTGGIILEGEENKDKWLNPIDSLMQEVMTLNRGDKVKLEINQGEKGFVIEELELLEKGESPQETQGSYNDGALLGVSIKVASEQVKGKPEEIVDYAKRLYDYAKRLKKE